MFDVGFWELSLIMVVALVVIGPERLPGVARKAGKWVGRGRQFVRTIKSDIDRELAADELRSILKEQAKSNPLHEIIEETRDSLGDTNKAFLVDAMDESAKASTSKQESPKQESPTESAVPGQDSAGDLNSIQDDTKR